MVGGNRKTTSLLNLNALDFFRERETCHSAIVRTLEVFESGPSKTVLTATLPESVISVEMKHHPFDYQGPDELLLDAGGPARSSSPHSLVGGSPWSLANTDDNAEFLRRRLGVEAPSRTP